MDRRKKVLVLMIAVTLAGTAIVATEFAQVTVTFTVTIASYNARIQLIAGDGNPLGSGYVLKRNTNGSYDLQLGTWAVGTTKVFTATFALINLENEHLRVTYIKANGAGASQLTMYLHENKTKTANANAVPTSSATYLENNVDTASCDADGSSNALRYVNAGASDTHITDGYVLNNSYNAGAVANRDGYNQSASPQLRYHKDSDTVPGAGSVTMGASEEPTAANGFVWVDPSPGGDTVRSSCHPTDATAKGTTALATKSNAIWVEVDIVASSFAAGSVSSLQIFFRSLGA